MKTAILVVFLVASAVILDNSQVVSNSAAPEAAFDTSRAESDAAVAIAYAQLIELPEPTETQRAPSEKPETPKSEQPKEVIFGGHKFRRLGDGWEYLDRDGVWQKHPGNDALPARSSRRTGR